MDADESPQLEVNSSTDEIIPDRLELNLNLEENLDEETEDAPYAQEQRTSKFTSIRKSFRLPKTPKKATESGDISATTMKSSRSLKFFSKEHSTKSASASANLPTKMKSSRSLKFFSKEPAAQSPSASANISPKPRPSKKSSLISLKEYVHVEETKTDRMDFIDQLEEAGKLTEPPPRERSKFLNETVDFRMQQTDKKARAGKKKTTKLDSMENYIKINGAPKTATVRYLRPVQSFHPHIGPIWVVEFSPSGDYLASAGKDGHLMIWQVDKNIFSGISEVNIDGALGSPKSASSLVDEDWFGDGPTPNHYLRPEPIRELRGHTSDIICVSWSKNNFILSLSKDKTIRLWHPSTDRCLRTFVFQDFITTVNFHPYDENIFLAGFLDGTVRIYSILNERLLSLAHTDDIITCSAISPDGKTALFGTYHGYCKFYELFPEGGGNWYFRHTTQIDLRKKGRGKPKKVAGISFMPESREIAISCNDSMVRIFRMDDKALNCMYSGHTNTESHFKAKFSPDEKLLISPSENKQIYIWRVIDTFSNNPKEMGVNVKNFTNLSGGSFQPFSEQVSSTSFGVWPNRRKLDQRQFPYFIAAGSFKGELKIFHSLSVRRRSTTQELPKTR